MKKLFNSKLVSLTLAMLLSISVSPVAYAAEMENINSQEYERSDSMITPTSVNAHVSYYPADGYHNSGVFTGEKSNPTVYTYLPTGIMNIAYSFYGGTNCKILFYYENQSNVAAQTNWLLSDNTTDSTTVTLTKAGRYRVVVLQPNSSANRQVNYAFNLYTD